MCERNQNVREKSGFVVFRKGFGENRERREIRSVCCNVETIEGDLGQESAQLSCALIVGDETGDANVESEIQVSFELVFRTSKTKDHTFGKPTKARLEDVDKILVCFAAVQQARLVVLEGEIELTLEKCALDDSIFGRSARRLGRIFSKRSARIQ